MGKQFRVVWEWEKFRIMRTDGMAVSMGWEWAGYGFSIWDNSDSLRSEEMLCYAGIK